MVELIDLIKDLTNEGLPAMWDPLQNVPSIYTNAIAANSWMNPQNFAEEKDPFDWQQEVVEEAWKTGKPQLLRLVSTLVLAAITALDTRNELWDRTTHGENYFGKVRTTMMD